MATPGLLSMKSYTFCEPIRNVETIFPLSIALFRPLITPLSTSGSHAVGEHLGMDAEILVAAELSEHGVRNRADTHLQAGPVFDQRGAVFADRRLDFVGLREMSFLERRVVLHEQVDGRRRE